MVFVNWLTHATLTDSGSKYIGRVVRASPSVRECIGVELGFDRWKLFWRRHSGRRRRGEVTVEPNDCGGSLGFSLELFSADATRSSGVGEIIIERMYKPE